MIKETTQDKQMIETSENDIKNLRSFKTSSPKANQCSGSNYTTPISMEYLQKIHMGLSVNMPMKQRSKSQILTPLADPYPLPII